MRPVASELPPELAGAVVSSAPFRAAVAGPASGARPAAPPVTPALRAEQIEEIEDFEVLDEEPAPSVVAPAQRKTAVAAPAAKHADPNAPVVLVVEDDASIRTMLVRALGMTYTVFEADDGQSALEILAQIPAPACIVSDWMMPRLDGIELAKRVRADKNLKFTPFLMLTAKNNAMDIVKGINAGARHYLAKPFKMKELLEKVASVLGPKGGKR